MLERMASVMTFLGGGRIGFMSGDISTVLGKNEIRNAIDSR
jgi:hypothetical protein